jgi:hypothetical protein
MSIGTINGLQEFVSFKNGVENKVLFCSHDERNFNQEGKLIHFSI